MTDTSRLSAWLDAQKLAGDYELSGLSAQEINRLSMTDYARIRERAGLPAIDPYADAYASYEPPAPQGQEAGQNAPGAPQSAPQGIDPYSDEFFLAWRANRRSGGEHKGIFDSVGSQSDAYREATARQAGRGALSNANVVEPPRLTGRFVNHDERLDHRSARDRFSVPGNAFNL